MENTVSLGTLALELRVNKSRLAYYFSEGLLVPVGVVGRMNIFNKKDALSRIKKIEAYQEKGKSLKEIKELVG